MPSAHAARSTRPTRHAARHSSAQMHKYWEGIDWDGQWEVCGLSWLGELLHLASHGRTWHRPSIWARPPLSSLIAAP